MNEADLAEYARMKGFYVEQIRAWRDACINAKGGIAKEAAPFWSYVAYFDGTDRTLMKQILLNVVMFVPIGFCLAALDRRPWQAAVIGFALSAAIEVTQLILCLGLFEFDDMIHNTVGTMIGVWTYRAGNRALEKMRRRKDPSTALRSAQDDRNSLRRCGATLPAGHRPSEREPGARREGTGEDSSTRFARSG